MADAPTDKFSAGEQGLGYIYQGRLALYQMLRLPESTTVFLEKDDAPDFWRVRVEDDGPGIPAENLETVFERFYTSRPKGTAFGNNSGLGLSIVRQIIKAREGTVVAANRIDAEGTVTGATFTVRLPNAAKRN